MSSQLCVPALVLGILSVVFDFIAFFIYAIILSGIGLALSVVGLVLALQFKQKEGKQDIASLVLCAVGAGIGFIFFIISLFVLF